MKTIIAALLLIMSTHTQAQTTYVTAKDDDGGLIFNGPITFADLNKEASFVWLKSGEKEYTPQEQATLYLTAYLKNYTMVVFMGTWCDDSHYLVPKLEKVLEKANYPMSMLTMYGVDREKTTRNGDQAKYNITLVPTIMLFKDGKEIGRITESAAKSVEEDLAAMIVKDSGKAMPK